MLFRPAPTVHVVITTYNRPALLTLLLRDLQEERKRFPDAAIHIHVYDDGSTTERPFLEEFPRIFGDTYLRSDVNNGARHFWSWTQRIYDEMQTAMVGDEYFIFLMDDCRLCDGFFEKALRAWNGISHPSKIALNLLVDSSRVHGPCWTAFTPVEYSDQIMETNWIDGIFICTGAYFKAVCPVPSDMRWMTQPGLGTHMWSNISMRLSERKLRTYQVKNSLAAHIDEGISVLCPEERKRHPMHTVRFEGSHRLQNV